MPWGRVKETKRILDDSIVNTGRTESQEVK